MTPELRKQNRRQFLAAFQRRRIGRTPGVEELHELLASAVFVPFAVALDDRVEMIGGLAALVLCVEGCGKLEARLMIERIGVYLLLQFVSRSNRLRLLGKLQSRTRGGDRLA